MRRSDRSVGEPSLPLRRRLPFLLPVCLGLASLGVSLPARSETGEATTIVAVSTPDVPAARGGAEVATGVRAAFAEIAARGGLLGRPIRLIELNDDCSAASAVRAAEQAVIARTVFVVGHVCSAAAIAAAPIYARHGIVLVTPGARSPRLTDSRAGPTVFRLAGRDDRFGEDAASLIATRFPAARVALVHDKSLEARTLAGAMEAGLAARGRTPVLREAYVAGEREYDGAVRRLAAAGADLVVFPAQPIEASVVFAAWRRVVPGGTLIASALVATGDIEAVARTAGDHLIVMLPADTGLAEARIALRSRAAVEAWAFAVAVAGSLDGRAVAEAMAAASHATSHGPLRFDRKGDADLPSYAPHVWRNGGWHPLGD